MKRTNPTRIAAGTLLLSALATSAQSAIFDRDDRQYAKPALTSIYSPVGLVRQGSMVSVWRSFTTGFLIDDCHVLTSQAVLGYGQAPSGKRLKFETGIGTREHESATGTVVAAGGLQRNRTAQEQWQRGGQDWLLLRLDKCLGARFGHVTLKTGPFSPYEFRDLKSVGYPGHRSRGKGLTLDPSCRVIGGRGTVWLNDCAALKGDAGDPIFRTSMANGLPRMEVYAMQSTAFRWAGATPLRPGYENQAVPMSLILPHIQKYLSLNDRRPLGPQREGGPLMADALSHVGAGAGFPVHEQLLDSGLVAANARSRSDGGAE